MRDPNREPKRELNFFAKARHIIKRIRGAFSKENPEELKPGYQVITITEIVDNPRSPMSSIIRFYSENEGYLRTSLPDWKNKFGWTPELNGVYGVKLGKKTSEQYRDILQVHLPQAK